MYGLNGIEEVPFGNNRFESLKTEGT